VVLASPARVSATLVAETDAPLAAALAEVRYAGLTVVALGYDTADVPHALDGYGYLVTRPEGLVTLGVVWESSLFAGRAPRGRVLVRAMLGGMRAPEVAHLPPDECLGLARAELGDVIGVRAAPVYSSVIRWPDAIAQYTPGHLARMERLRALLAERPGLHVCGTSYDGVSFNHAIKSGRQTARMVLQGLLERRDLRPVDARTA
jgi:oxygen-dependent protoporphyrinogen oxidase